MAVVGDDFAGKVLQHLPAGQVAHEAVVGQQVDDACPGPRLLKFLGNSFADAFGPASDHGDLMFKPHKSLLQKSVPASG